MRRKAIAGLVALAAALGASAAIPAAQAALSGGTTAASTASAAAAARTGPGDFARPGALPGAALPGGAFSSARHSLALAPAASVAAWNFFTGASCVHAGDCLAVGGNNNGGGGHGSPLASLWNGTWHATAVHLPAGATAGYLYGVSCTSGTAGGCVAVGYYRKNNHSYPLAQYWHGNGWSLGKLPAIPAGGINSALQAISCVTATSCVATGAYAPNTTNSIGLAEFWNGSTWKAFRPPTPATPYSFLDTVSCATTTYCLAGGAYYTNTDAPVLAELWTGSAWHQVAVRQPALPAQSVTEIDGLSCTSTTTCVMTGDTEQFHSNGTVTMSTFAEAQTAGAWSLTPVPMPAGQQSLLNSVSCTSATSCVASGGVGPYTNSWTQGHAATATWNGSAWTVRVLTPPSGQGSVLWSDTCASATYCVAVGTIGTFGTKTGHALTAFWNGVTWHTVNTL